MVGQGNVLWIKGGKTLAQVEEGLQAILHQLEDVNPPESDTIKQEPHEIQERFSREMLDKGYIVPVTVFRGTKEEMDELRNIMLEQRWHHAESIKSALEVIREIRLQRGEI